MEASASDSDSDYQQWLARVQRREHNATTRAELEAARRGGDDVATRAELEAECMKIRAELEDTHKKARVELEAERAAHAKTRAEFEDERERHEKTKANLYAMIGVRPSQWRSAIDPILTTASAYPNYGFRPDVVAALRANPKGRAPGGIAMLHVVACVANVPAVQYLVLVERVEVDARDDTGRTAAHFAALSGKTDVIKWLATVSSATVEAAMTTPKAYRPIHIAAMSGWTDAVIFLIAYKKGVANSLAGNNVQPIHVAAGAGRLEIVRQLAAQPSVSIVALTTHGRQPIHYAAEAGHADVVGWLVRSAKEKHMPNPAEARDNNGKTAMDLAVANKRENVIVVLRAL